MANKKEVIEQVFRVSGGVDPKIFSELQRLTRLSEAAVGAVKRGVDAKLQALNNQLVDLLKTARAEQATLQTQLNANIAVAASIGAPGGTPVSAKYVGDSGLIFSAQGAVPLSAAERGAQLGGVNYRFRSRMVRGEAIIAAKNQREAEAYAAREARDTIREGMVSERAADREAAAIGKANYRFRSRMARGEASYAKWARMRGHDLDLIQERVEGQLGDPDQLSWQMQAKRGAFYNSLTAQRALLQADNPADQEAARETWKRTMQGKDGPEAIGRGIAKGLSDEAKKDGGDRGILDRYITRGGILRGATGVIGGLANLELTAMQHPGRAGAVNLATQGMAANAVQGLGTAAVMAGAGPIGWVAAIGGAIWSAFNKVETARYERGMQLQDKSIDYQDKFSKAYGWGGGHGYSSNSYEGGMARIARQTAENRRLKFTMRSGFILPRGADDYTGVNAFDTAAQDNVRDIRDRYLRAMAQRPYGMNPDESLSALNSWMQGSPTRVNKGTTSTIQAARLLNMDTSTAASLQYMGEQAGLSVGASRSGWRSMAGAMYAGGMNDVTINNLMGSLRQQGEALSARGASFDSIAMGSMLGRGVAAGVPAQRLGNEVSAFLSAKDEAMQLLDAPGKRIQVGMLLAQAARGQSGIAGARDALRDSQGIDWAGNKSLESYVLGSQGYRGSEAEKMAGSAGRTYAAQDITWQNVAGQPKSSADVEGIIGGSSNQIVVEHLQEAAKQINKAASAVQKSKDGMEVIDNSTWFDWTRK